jgi:phage antirepressor YoqD-like protein
LDGLPKADKKQYKVMNLERKETMSSKEIADLTGKMHNDVLKAIRIMEPSWQKVTGGNFPLSEYTDSTGRKLPMYQLSKTECLYVATKFNDEARAKLVIRWEQLETEKHQLPQTFSEALMLAARQAEQLELQQKQLREAAPKVEYHDEVLQSVSLIATNVIAKELGMSAVALNRKLHEKGVIYSSAGTWVLYQKYQELGYTGTKTHHYTDNHGVERTSVQTYWTEKGRKFIHELIRRQKSA